MTKPSQAERRKAFASKVLHDLALSHRSLPISLKDGSRPIVVALDDELLSAVVRRVNVSGGAANTFVELKNGRVMLLSVTRGSRDDSDAEVFSEQPMHESVTIGMMAEYVSHAPEGVIVTVHLTRLGAEVQYVDSRELIDA